MKRLVSAAVMICQLAWTPEVWAQDFRDVGERLDPMVGRVISQSNDGWGTGSGFVLNVDMVG
ncbi:MAG: hypothetical protein OXC91_01000 [Rhodobacteraceae bacterium]|nr:hypothetical protein [Paracoccaceae bacterium]